MDTTPAPTPPGADPRPDAPPQPVDLSDESVAGEEDPGAALDTSVKGPAPSPVPGTTKPSG